MNRHSAVLVRQKLRRRSLMIPVSSNQAHLVDERLGIVNVPRGVWINEQGMIVPLPESPVLPRRRDLGRGYAR